jgi:hypothetical protein
LGILEDVRGRGPAPELVIEADPGRGQVPIGAGRLPAEHDRHEPRLVPGGHGLVLDPDDVPFGGRAAQDLLGAWRADLARATASSLEMAARKQQLGAD